MLSMQTQNSFVNISEIFSWYASCLTNSGCSRGSTKSQCRKPEVCRIQATGCAWRRRKTLQHPSPKLPFSKPSLGVLSCAVWGAAHTPRKQTNLLPPTLLTLGGKRKQDLVPARPFLLDEVRCRSAAWQALVAVFPGRQAAPCLAAGCTRFFLADASRWCLQGWQRAVSEAYGSWLPPVTSLRLSPPASGTLLAQPCSHLQLMAWRARL